MLDSLLGSLCPVSTRQQWRRSEADSGSTQGDIQMQARLNGAMKVKGKKTTDKSKYKHCIISTSNMCETNAFSKAMGNYRDGKKQG